MENQIIEKVGLLPLDQQKQVLDFIEFLLEKYLDKTLEEIQEIPQNLAISDTLKAYLDKRLEEIKTEKRFSIEQIESLFNEKYPQKNV